MYRLLIVDDEPAIVGGLVELFEQLEEPQLDICKAYSAAEALRIVKKTKIDIVLSDIRMPGKSGLQMLDEIAFYWPNCRIIFLTGYSEFDYVYTSIQKNVENYILKTEDDEVVIEVILAVVRKLDEEARERRLVELAQRQSRIAESMIRKDLWTAVLTGEPAGAIFGRMEPADEFDWIMKLNLKVPVLLLAAGVTSWGERPLAYREKLDILYRMLQAQREALPAWLLVEDLVYESYTPLWIIQPDLSNDDSRRFLSPEGHINWDALSAYLRSMLEAVQVECQERMGIEASYVISRPGIAWERIPEQFGAIRTAIQWMAASGASMSVLDLNDEAAGWGIEQGRRQRPDYLHHLKQLESSLDEGDASACEIVTRKLIREVRAEAASNPFAGAEMYLSMLQVYFARIRHAAPPDVGGNEWQMRVMGQMGLPSDWVRAESELIELGQMLCARRAEPSEKAVLLLNRVHRYIRDNLSGDLSLIRIAEAVHFNPSYLSRYYKQLTGRKLFDYIHEVKAEEAMAMLKNAKLKINEIAPKLGFESSSYFTAFFRRMTGLSPQEFRDSYLARQDSKRN